MSADPDASKDYDPTADEYYYGYGCTVVSSGAKIPIAVEFTEIKQAPEETAIRATSDTLAVKIPLWIVSDSGYYTLNWHNLCGQQVVVPVTPYNPRDTDDPLGIEYKVEGCIDKHSKDVRLKQSTLEETHNRWI